MDPYEGGSDDDEDGLLGALRKIGATFDPLRSASDLGEDVLDTRLRAKAAAKGGQGSAEAQACYEDMRRRHQVDLNDARHFDDLEDKGLVEHMRVARRQFQANATREASLPSREDLLRGDTEGRRALSALMTGLKEQQMALQCACDEVHAHATNAGRLSRNEQPHGYPEVEPPSEALAKCLAHLEKKVTAAVADLNGVITALEAFERGLTLARRNYETVVDGLRRRGEHFEDAYKGGPEG